MHFGMSNTYGTQSQMNYIRLILSLNNKVGIIHFYLLKLLMRFFCLYGHSTGKLYRFNLHNKYKYLSYTLQQFVPMFVQFSWQCLWF